MGLGQGGAVTRISSHAFRVLLALAFPASLVAQAKPKPQPEFLKPGRWRGWIQQIDQDSTRVSYDVNNDGKHNLITLIGRSGAVYDMSEIKLKDDVLQFLWYLNSASMLNCRLARRDGITFHGECNDRSAGQSGKWMKVWISMAPDTTRT